LIEDRFTMDVIATESRIANSNAAHDYLSRGSEAGFVWSTRIDDLNVESVPANPLLRADRKWAIRFNAGGTITIVLGMRDYGRGWFSAYFAGVLAVRLGIPFRRIRVYYSATLPAVLQTPQPFRILLHGSYPGPVARAAADVIEEMCDRVIEKGRSIFAALAGVGDADIGFDQPTGRFYVLDRDRSGSILEVAKIIQRRIACVDRFREETSDFGGPAKLRIDPH
jgi:CO/xanthine dehydrogenase Mo-binding subunit